MRLPAVRETSLMLSDDRIDLLSRLFQDRYGLVVGVARRYAPTKDDIDDIVQQVYIEFATGGLKKNWDLDQDVGPLLYRITKNTALALWRRQYAENARSLERVEEELIAWCDEEYANEQEEYERHEARIGALMACLKKLPAKHRAFIEQHYFERRSMKEIAERHGAGASAVRHFFCRIRSLLRNCIRQTIDD